MQSIVEREATFENNSDIEVKVINTEKIITSICKGNTMKHFSSYNSAIYIRKSPPHVNIKNETKGCKEHNKLKQQLWNCWL